MELKIGKIKCGYNQRPLMIAEEGQANHGDVALAMKMIGLAGECGADGIEFQLFIAEDMYARDHKGYKTYLETELPLKEIPNLVKLAHENNLIFIATCLSPKLIEICCKAEVDAFCINASDINNPFMLDAVSESGKPYFMATLMSTIEEIDWTVNYLKKRSCTDFGILHGQHVMSSDKLKGVPPELVQLDCINAFKQRYSTVVGYVDHTSSKIVPALAAIKGSDIIMKHLAPEDDWKGPDWVVCLSPKEWKECNEIFKYSLLTNGASKELSLAEIKDRTLHRRGLYIKTDIEAGAILNKDNLIALRPSKGGIDPQRILEITGRKVKTALGAQHLLLEEDLHNL